MIFLLASIQNAIKLEKKHAIGRRYRIVSSKLSSKRTFSIPKISNPKSISRMPASVNLDTIRRVTIPNYIVFYPIGFLMATFKSLIAPLQKLQVK